ncbi:MAG: holo-ACP synthase [Anaerolineaceae bacterium]|nr:holo-ACP synthase [Anaerolineaceae bacterium]
MNTLRTGIDMIEVERFRSQRPEIRKRFIERVYTEREIAYCGDNEQHLAGRFAAKEAVSKALGCGIGEISWQEIEILNDDLGAPVLRLHGKAAERSEALGLTLWSVSITHLKEYAAAIAVAMNRE